MKSCTREKLNKFYNINDHFKYFTTISRAANYTLPPNGLILSNLCYT